MQKRGSSCFQLSDISATLKYGEFIYKIDKKKLLIISLFVLIIFFIVAAFLIFDIVAYCYGKGDLVETIILGVVLALIGLVVPWYIIVGTIKKKKQKNEVALWLEDAIELQAMAFESGAWSSKGFLKTKLYKLQVSFDFECKKRSFESKNKHIQFVFWAPDGYDEIWGKYIDKEIRILYSPKYEEVMLLSVA